MPQSLAALHVHLIFSTKGRVPSLGENVRTDLHGYLAGILKEVDCHPIVINSVEDHIHLLFDLGRTVAISRVVETLKTGSSKWLKTRDPRLACFAWQSGYGAFAVSESNVAAVHDYVRNQEEHHRKHSFQEEYRMFLQRHRLPYDESTYGTELSRPFRAWRLLGIVNLGLCPRLPCLGPLGLTNTWPYGPTNQSGPLGLTNNPSSPCVSEGAAMSTASSIIILL